MNIEVINELNNISDKIIGGAIEVHRSVGPGLFENVYESCLCHELRLRGLSFERQKVMPMVYKGQTFTKGFRIDLLVEDKVIVELKSVATVLPIHEAQLLNYLKLSNLKLGLLFNFNVPMLKNGIYRMVNGL